MSSAARVTAVFGTLALALGGVLVTAGPASAATLQVNAPGDGAADVGTLRWALTQAEALPGPDTIEIDAFAGSIPAGATALPQITEDLVITGPGSATFYVEAVGTVFDITGGTVSISGLTLISASANALGVHAVGSDVTLDDIVADGFDDTGIYVEDGSLSITDSVASSNDYAGIEYHAVTPAHDLALTRVTTDSNGSYGINASLQGGVITGADLTADDNTMFGAALVLMPGSTGTVTGISASDNGFVGLVADAENAQLAISGSVTDRNAVGTVADASSGGTITISASSATDNGSQGFAIVSDDSTVSLLSSDSVSNGNDPCGCGGPGVSVDAYASEITISDADLTDNEASFGGGLDVVELSGGSSLLVANSRILRNAAVEDQNLGGLGGGIAVEFFADGGTTMTISDSTIDSNTAQFAGGGIYLGDLGAGSPTGGVTILRTTISNNAATPGASAGGGLSIDGFSQTLDGSPIVTIDSSTISGNSADDSGGLGGFKYDTSTDPGVIDVVNTTISGNDAQQNGAGYFGSDADTGNAVIRVRHSTILDNSASGGPGGLFVDYELDFVLDHSILAFNTPGDLQVDSLNVFTPTWNIVRDPEVATAALLTAGGNNRIAIDPELGPLALNGGTTMTHLPLDGSPAINTGDPAFAAPPTLDQRGLPRVVRIVDIGAAEVAAATVLPATGTAATPAGPPLTLVLLFAGVLLVVASRVRRHA